MQIDGDRPNLTLSYPCAYLLLKTKPLLVCFITLCVGKRDGRPPRCKNWVGAPMHHARTSSTSSLPRNPNQGNDVHNTIIKSIYVMLHWEHFCLGVFTHTDMQTDVLQFRHKAVRETEKVGQNNTFNGSDVSL